MGAVVVEQRAHDEVDLRMLASRLRPQVHPLEHERSKLGHRTTGHLALDDVAFPLGALDQVVHESVDPARPGIPEDPDRATRQVAGLDHTSAQGVVDVVVDVGHPVD